MLLLEQFALGRLHLDEASPHVPAVPVPIGTMGEHRISSGDYSLTASACFSKPRPRGVAPRRRKPSRHPTLCALWKDPKHS